MWDAATTTDRDRKQLLHTLLDEVNITVHRDDTDAHAELVVRWKGGAISELTVPVKRSPPTGCAPTKTPSTCCAVSPSTTPTPPSRTSSTGKAAAPPEDCHTPPVGSSHCATTTTSPATNPATTHQEGELLTVADAAKELGLAPSTLHRWLGDGFIAGEQLTPGAPWRIRLTDDIRALFVDDAPDGWLAMLEATLAYGVSRQTIMQRVKRGELKAVHVRTGRRKGLRIQPPPTQEGLF